MSVIKLVDRGVVPRETAKEVSGLLEKFVSFSESKEVDTVIIIAKREDGSWMFDFAGNAFATEMLGRLELVKAEIIQRYLSKI